MELNEWAGDQKHKVGFSSVRVDTYWPNNKLFVMSPKLLRPFIKSSNQNKQTNEPSPKYSLNFIKSEIGVITGAQ